MIRGTTAQFKFNLPYPYHEISSAKITFWQPGNDGSADYPLPLVKTLSSCSRGSSLNEICVTLSQLETMAFSEESRAYVQFRGLASDGSAFASKQEGFIVYPVYDDTELEGGKPPEDIDGDGWETLDAGTIGGVLI